MCVAVVHVNNFFGGHCAAAGDSAAMNYVGYHCLALEPDALLTYVAVSVLS